MVHWLIVLLLALATPALGATRIALHLTQEELNILKNRAVNGPYRVAGDVSPNSPGDWTRILNNANTFRDAGSPKPQRWNGYTGTGCMTEAAPGPGLEAGTMLRDAAFAYLVTGRTAYRDAVRTELIAQTGLAGVQFTNTTKFSRASGCLPGAAGQKIQQINAWVQHLTIGYDYVRSTFTSGQRAAIDAWFLGAARFLNSYPVFSAEQRWPNRNSNNYTTPTPPANSPCANDIRYSTANPYAEAPCRREWQDAWNNLLLSHSRTAGTIGVMLGNTALINSAKRHMREWLMFMIYPDGSSGELDRWTTDNPNRGMGYWGGTLGHYIVFADALCRARDCELYNYSTSHGYYGTAGGPKTLLASITEYLQMREHTIVRYAAKGASAQTAERIMDGIHTGHHDIGDVWITPANHFYRSSFIKGHYLRTSSDPQVLDYPANPAGGQLWWGGNQMIWPGILFQFGNLEGRVRPYE